MGDETKKNINLTVSDLKIFKNQFNKYIGTREMTTSCNPIDFQINLVSNGIVPIPDFYAKVELPKKKVDYHETD